MRPAPRGRQSLKGAPKSLNRDFAQTDPAPISSNLIGADQLLIGQKPGLAQKRKVSNYMVEDSCARRVATSRSSGIRVTLKGKEWD
jgi:hypothetical protein